MAGHKDSDWSAMQKEIQTVVDKYFADIQELKKLARSGALAPSEVSARDNDIEAKLKNDLFDIVLRSEFSSIW
jgi:hypothetical protein